MLYKGFISYSHAADDRLAPALQSALHRFAKPWYRLRAMRIFRDKTSLSANPALWLTIEKALHESEWFLLMASPKAAQSQWVGQEIAWWLAHRSTDRMLILLTEGDLAWDEAAADFDWTRTSVLAPTLRGKFSGEPLYVDLRWAKGRDRLNLRHSQFRGAILDVAAPLLGRAKDELDGEDVRQHRRTRRVVFATGVALLALTALSVTAAYFAIQQARIAQSRELATSASAQLPFDPELSVLLAAEGARISHTVESESALRAALLESHVRGTMRGDSALWSAVYSADGRRIATAGETGAVRVWDTESLAPIAELRGEMERVHSMAFSNDGRYVVAAAEGGSVRVWDVEGATSIAHFDGHPGLVGPASFSPDSRLLTVAQGDNSVLVWDLAEGRAAATLRGHTAAVRSAAFSPDGTTIITASDDATARVWDVAARTTIAELRVPMEPVTKAAFSRDGRLAAIVSPVLRTVQIWRTDTWKAIATLTTESQPVDAVFSPNGERVAVIESLGDRLWLWDTATGEVVKELAGHVGRIFDVEFSGDGALVVTGSEDKTARVWDVRTGALVSALRGHRGIVTHVAFSPGGSHVLSASLDATARIWEGVPLEVTIEQHEYTVRGALSRDGKTVVTAANNVVSIWAVDDGTRRLALPRSTERIVGVELSQDGRFFLTAGFKGTVRIYETATGRLAAELRRDEEMISRAVFSPDGTLLATTSGGVNPTPTHVWDIATGKVLADLPGSAGRAGNGTFNRDGTRVVTIVEEKAIVWDARSGRMIAEVAVSKGSVTAAAFSPDGAGLLTTDTGRMAQLWEVATGRPLVMFAGHTDALTRGAFSPDGHLIVTVAQDSTARVWEAATGNQLAELRGDRDNWAAASFNPRGTLVITSGGHNGPTVWDARTGARLIELAGSSESAFSADGKRLFIAGDTVVVYTCEECGPLDALMALARARLTRQLTSRERSIFLHEAPRGVEEPARVSP